MLSKEIQGISVNGKGIYLHEQADTERLSTGRTPLRSVLSRSAGRFGTRYIRYFFEAYGGYYGAFLDDADFYERVIREKDMQHREHLTNALCRQWANTRLAVLYQIRVQQSRSMRLVAKIAAGQTPEPIRDLRHAK